LNFSKERKTMKATRILMAAAFIAAMAFTAVVGCKYDVAEPLWDQPPGSSLITTISSIQPPQATPGVNTITIFGTNFTGVFDTSSIHNPYVDTSFTYNGVFFDNMPGEVIAYTSTSVTVRRPNLASDTCTVKVAPKQALVAGRLKPYRIDPVLLRYGSFLDNVQLSAVAVDQSENVYVIEASSRTISKVTPGGNKTILATAPLPPTDARIGPDGKLYLPAANRIINAVDVQTGAIRLWRRCPSGKIIKFGDFDVNGNFYGAGIRTDLVIMPPDSTFRNAGFYSALEVLAVRVYNRYVYVAARTGLNPATIWSHPIDSSGNVGAQELVLDMSLTGDFASRNIQAITFSANGTMYIATDAPDPILVFDPASGSLDYFYKNILPPYCKQFYWGSQTFIYMISGNTSPAQEWTLHRVDLGTTGAPYY